MDVISVSRDRHGNSAGSYQGQPPPITHGGSLGDRNHCIPCYLNSYV